MPPSCNLATNTASVLSFSKADSNDGESQGGPDQVLESLQSAIVKSRGLRELHCSQVLDDPHVEALDGILRAHHDSVKLQSLKLPGNNLTASSSYAISHILQCNPTLKELDISNNPLKAEGLTSLLDALTMDECRITSLNLTDTSLGPKGASAIASLLRNNSSILHLLIGRNRLGTSSIKSIGKSLCENSTLLQLDISHNKIADRGASLLAPCLDPEVSKSQLQDLDVTFNKITAKGSNQLVGALLEGNKTLTRLNMSMNAIGSEGANAFGVLLKFSHTLTDLNLSRNNIGDGLLAIADALVENDQVNLQRLDLSWNSLTDACVSRLADFFRGRNCTMEHLDLSSNAIGDAGIKALVTALPFDLTLSELSIIGNQMRDPEPLVHLLCHQTSALQILHYEKNNMTAEAEQRLKDAFLFRENRKSWLGRLLREIERRRTVSINLSQKEYGDEEVISLCRHLTRYSRAVSTLFLGGPRLTHRSMIMLANEVLAYNGALVQFFYLKDIKLSDAVVESLAHAVVSNTSLRCVSLSHCDVSTNAVRLLANGLRRNSTISRVNLTGNSFDDHGARDLLKVLLNSGHGSLVSLNLADNGLTDSCLGELPRITSLEELHLDGNRLTDYGALDIAKALMSNRTIRWLNLSGNPISPKGIKALELFLPNPHVLDFRCQDQL